jgi:3-hydroxyisobutyrate dehydrogenase
MKTTIGFIGLGHMGLPMALGLVAGGFQVMGYDLNPVNLDIFCKSGGYKGDLQQLANTSDVIITMLPSGAQLLEIYDLLLADLKPNALLIDCSTVGTLASRHWHQKVNDQGLRSVDAPVSGGVLAAKNKSLTFMLGGDTPDVQMAQQILNLIGKQFIHTGGKTSGQTAKICNNLILANNMAALSEAFVLAEQLGLEKNKFLEIVQNSSGNSWIVEKYLPIPDLKDHVPANQNYEPGFSTQMMAKDLNLVEACCQQLGIKLNLTEATLHLYQQMLQENLGSKDFSYIYQFLKS